MRNTKAGTQKLTVSYRDDLIDRLRKDPGYAAAYLNAALSEGRDVFLLALRDVAQARVGMTRLARKTALHRVSLYDTLSEGGNPRFASLDKILGELGMRLSIVERSKSKRSRSKAS